MEKVLKLGKGDKLSVLNENNEGILITNKGNTLKIIETNKKYENTYIKELSNSEIISYVLTTLLENNSIEIRGNDNNNQLISKLLENQFSNIGGKEFQTRDVLSMKFMVVTCYEKE